LIGRIVFRRGRDRGLYCEVTGAAEWRPVHSGDPGDAPPGAVLAYRRNDAGDLEVYVLTEEEFTVLSEDRGRVLVGWCGRCPLGRLRRQDMMLPPCMFEASLDDILSCADDRDCVVRFYGEEGLRIIESLGLPFEVEFTLE